MLLGVARDLGELVHHTQTHCSWPSSSEKNWRGAGREVAGCGVWACVRVRVRHLDASHAVVFVNREEGVVARKHRATVGGHTSDWVAGWQGMLRRNAPLLLLGLLGRERHSRAGFGHEHVVGLDSIARGIGEQGPRARRQAGSAGCCGGKLSRHAHPERLASLLDLDCAEERDENADGSGDGDGCCSPRVVLEP